MRLRRPGIDGLGLSPPQDGGGVFWRVSWMNRRAGEGGIVQRCFRSRAVYRAGPTSVGRMAGRQQISPSWDRVMLLRRPTDQTRARAAAI